MTKLSGLLVCLAVVSVGCGGSSFPDPVPVSGVVTYQGEPVSEAKITFLSTTGGRSASGTTDAQGNYELTTFNTGDGAIPDDYTITIAKFDVSESGGDIDVDSDDPGANYGAMMDSAAETGEAISAEDSELPAMYADPAKSGLARTVAEGQPNQFNFDL